MNRLQVLKAALAGSASVVTLLQPAAAKPFDIPSGDLPAVLTAYVKQSNVEVAFADDDVRGHKSRGVKGDYTETAALDRLLRGTGFTTLATSPNAVVIVQQKPAPEPAQIEVAQAAPRKAPATDVETVVVTAQKKAEDIQQVPIAVTALSQAQLTERQIAGGPDLVKEVPNLTFTKTNFTGYNLEIRGIGTQAISVTTDPAVAVAFNSTPFIRNHFFEQEFYDLRDAEVLRGPQGTLYGRNATAGVVNLKSALPTDQFEAMMSADFGNFSNRRYEGMINIPVTDDRLDIRIAGEWTKRDGYSFNSFTNAPIDGRDLWSGRVSIGWKPIPDLQTYFIWEHFQESDNRLRSAKQLCKTDVGPGGAPLPPNGYYLTGSLYINGSVMYVGPGFGEGDNNNGNYFLQGCVPTSLYSPQAFQAPISWALPYVLAAGGAPYTNELQSTNLRVIDTQLNPIYEAKNDTIEFNADYEITPALTFTSQTGYNQDFLWSSEDFNRFGSASGSWINFCDPQLGCANRLVVEDLSDEHAWQFSQEFRLASNFGGPLNFSAGVNYLHYETVEDYYVFINSITAFVGGGYTPGTPPITIRPPLGFQYLNPKNPDQQIDYLDAYTDPTPLTDLAGTGHNYYRNMNPYVLNSYAGFGEVYYNVTNDIKLTGGLRWTEDRKHFLEVPSWIVDTGYGYPVTGVLDQKWDRLTGRAVVDWTPKLDFTDQTLIYGSYAHGYKAGGANPPGAIFDDQGARNPVHPLTFKPEYIEAFEFGAKNTLLDGALTINGDIFYYNYTGYQISEIVDRTAINHNYNAHVEGAELETNWEPAPGLKFAFTGGYENTGIAGGTEDVDLMDRTAGHVGWYVAKPFISQASNCVFPGYVAQYLLHGGGGSPGPSGCEIAYEAGGDPVSGQDYIPNPTSCFDWYGQPSGGGSSCPPGYTGFDPRAGTPGDPYHGQNTGSYCVQNCNGQGTPVYRLVDYGPAPNDGVGFSKNLGGNQLPNAPHFTTSLTAEYTLPVSDDWAATFHSDFYWQSQSWWRVFNDKNYDKLHGYSNVNLALILTSADGWQVMGYVKNLFDTTAITGAFLNSDDTGLTTNAFLTDPRLYGVRVTKHFGEGDSGAMEDVENFIADLFADKDGGKPPLWIELGGQLDRTSGETGVFLPPFASVAAPKDLAVITGAQEVPPFAGGFEGKLSFEPDDSDWIVSASIRYGRSGGAGHRHHQSAGLPAYRVFINKYYKTLTPQKVTFADAISDTRETHMVLDFQAGKDVGLGMLGTQGSSVVSAGVRFAQFVESNNTTLHARPLYSLGPAMTGTAFGGFLRYRGFHADKSFQSNTAFLHSNRNTHAIGPSISWNASTPIAGNGSDESFNFDWGMNGAVLFGRQRARTQHQTSGYYLHNTKGIQGLLGHPTGHYVNAPDSSLRSRTVVIPNLGGMAGISVNFRNSKVTFGYRGDFFLNAMDTGFDKRRSRTVGFYGPFVNFSIGLGG